MNLRAFSQLFGESLVQIRFHHIAHLKVKRLTYPGARGPLKLEKIQRVLSRNTWGERKVRCARGLQFPWSKSVDKDHRGCRRSNCLILPHTLNKAYEADHPNQQICDTAVIWEDASSTTSLHGPPRTKSNPLKYGSWKTRTARRKVIATFIATIALCCGQRSRRGPLHHEIHQLLALE